MEKGAKIKRKGKEKTATKKREKEGRELTRRLKDKRKSWVKPWEAEKKGKNEKKKWHPGQRI